MGIYGALATAVSGLRAQSHAMENISGNIANSQTTGYKRIETSFSDLIPDAPVKSQVPGAVVSSSRSTNGDRGDIQNASTETFMALNGSGFFVVEATTGNTSGTYYTRRGDFDIDKNGYLVNGAGYRLQGLAMSGGVVTGSVPEAIKIDNSFMPAKASTTINYQLNLPQLPKTASYDATVPGSELFSPWSYSTSTGQSSPVIGGTNLPPAVGANTSGASITDGTAAGSTLVTSGQFLDVTIGGTTRRYVFDTDSSITLPMPGVDARIDASGNINSMLAAIQADMQTGFGADSDPGATFGLVNGQLHAALANSTATSLTIDNGMAGGAVLLGFNGVTANQLTGAAVTGANTPASMILGGTQSLTVKVGNVTRNYIFDTTGATTATPPSVLISAQGSVDAMLAAIQADLRNNGGAGASNATVGVVGSNISVTFPGNYSQTVTITSTGGNSLGINGSVTPNPGSVDTIAPGTDTDKFISQSIAGGGLTLFSQTGQPVNVQMRWAKTFNTAGDETWGLFYASGSPTAAWTKVGDYNFTDGVLTGMTAAPGTTAPDLGSVTVNNLMVNGTNLGAITIDHGAKGITQFADNAGTSTTTTLKQNGYGAGQFISVGVSDNGRIIASYTNGETKEVAQILIANFNAPNALKRGDGGVFMATSQSGEPILSMDGGIVGSSLEASNTDISEEFTKLIVTQQAYAANTRIVSAADSMLQETLNMMR